MLGSAAAIAFLPSTDLGRSQQFFADRLGLAVEEVTPYACVLRAGTTMLRVTKVDQLHPQPFTVFGWEVPDIDAVVTDLGGAGITCERFDGVDQDAAGVWTTPGGDRIAWFRDPDGNTLSLTQFVAARQDARRPRPIGPAAPDRV
jgi:catechol 2,3-dioxygenase-like lactoylglutathione lyase family enzyme